MRTSPVLSSDVGDQAKSAVGPYVPLLRLAEVWASDARLPVAMVLRNLCDWAMMGTFPPAALVTPAGDSVDAFDIFMSGKAALFGSFSFEGSEWYSSRWGLDLLANVLVSQSGIRAFCKRTNTVPPSIARRTLKRAWAVVRRKHLAPPACPEADEQAAKHNARQSAQAAINALRDMLTRLEGEPTTFKRRRVEERSINVEYWQDQWTTMREEAQRNVERCGDDELQRELDALESRWADFLAAEMQKTAAMPATPAEADTGTHGGDAEDVSSAERMAGRYSGAEAEAWYESWIRGNTEKGEIPTRDDDWAAAKDALGDGVPRDPIWELRRRKAPSSWQKKGRRKSADESGGRE